MHVYIYISMSWNAAELIIRANIYPCTSEASAAWLVSWSECAWFSRRVEIRIHQLKAIGLVLSISCMKTIFVETSATTFGSLLWTNWYEIMAFVKAKHEFPSGFCLSCDKSAQNRFDIFCRTICLVVLASSKWLSKRFISLLLSA